MQVDLKMADPGEIVSVLVLPDIHVPEHDEASIDAVLNYAREHRWDAVLQLGDFMDFCGLSRFSANDAVTLASLDIADEFKQGRQLLSRIQTACAEQNPDCFIFMLEGNHEARVHKFTMEMPQLRGLLNVPSQLGLEPRHDVWVRSDSRGEILRFDMDGTGVHARIYEERDAIRGDGVAFIHGWFVNTHHAKKTAERYGHGSIFYGHTHDVNLYSVHQYGPFTPEAGSLGHLARPQRYIRGRPTNWQQAFGVFHFSSEGFSRSIIKINNHKFISPDGKLYTGNEVRSIPRVETNFPRTTLIRRR